MSTLSPTVSSITSRKRARPGSPGSDFATPSLVKSTDYFSSDSVHRFADFGDGLPPDTDAFSPFSNIFSPDSMTSSAPLAHSRYRLAGGLESPAASRSNDLSFSGLWHSETSLSASLSDESFRRGRPYSHSSGAFAADHNSTEQLPTPLSREGNGRPRAISTAASQQREGAANGLYNTVTGVVGRVWNFCTAGSFKGFFAGGGKGYAMNVPQSGAMDGSTGDIGAEWQDLQIGTEHIPGGFPHSSSPMGIPDTPNQEERPSRAVKRSRTSYADDVCGSPSQSWVLVHDSPTRRKTAHSHTEPRAASPASVRRSTSKASLRRTASSYATQAPQAPRSAHARRASAVSLRSPHASPSHSRQNSGGAHLAEAKGKRPSLTPVQKPESPIALETAKFMKDMRKQEKREDKDISRMNRTLQDMIREAKEALGTTVEVEMDEDEW